jgi:hypothetical protein
MVKERANRIKPMLDALEQLDSYFQTWAKERVVGIEYLRYKSLRKSKYPKQIRNFERNWAVYKNKQSNALYERVASIIEEIEHKEIESIFLHC